MHEVVWSEIIYVRNICHINTSFWNEIQLKLHVNTQFWWPKYSWFLSNNSNYSWQNSKECHFYTKQHVITRTVIPTIFTNLFTHLLSWVNIFCASDTFTGYAKGGTVTKMQKLEGLPMKFGNPKSVMFQSLQYWAHPRIFLFTMC